MATLAKKDAIAEAIKDSINSATGPLVPWQPAERKHAFEITLEDVARADTAEKEIPITTVFPRAERKIKTSRNSYSHEYDIGICVQCYCPFSDRDRLDVFSRLVEEISDWIGTAGPQANATYMRHEMVSLFDASQLRESQQFVSATVFTYRIER